MRHALAVVALVVAVTAAAPAAHAQTVNQYGNAPVQWVQPGGNGGGSVYVDGTAQTPVQPAPLYLGTGADSATVAGPDSSQTVPSFYGGDTHR